MRVDLYSHPVFKVAMILSGSHVLFMDPRREYLGRGRSCYGPIPLKKMKRYANRIFKGNWYLIG